MYVASSQPTAYVDIDSTLIEWNLPSDGDDPNKIVTINNNKFVINTYNLEYIIKLGMRNHVLILWSAGGAEWAANVAKALKIENLIFACVNKPTYYVDDIADPRDFMGKHVFYDSKGNRTGFKPRTLAHEEDK
jgi:hypothetical protein